MSDRVIIFDTTLRDGEQSPGISLNTAEKLEIAHQLARLGVDVIEAGFPIASPGDFEAVRAIAREVHGPVIAGLARAHAADVERAAEAVRDAERPRIHTFISTSDIHIEHQLQSTREDVKAQARAAVAHSRSLVEDVEFSPMDATRADVEYTAEVLQVALDEGATTINIPDTVGYTMPHEIMDATTVGLDANSLVLGKHSGRHALKSALEELGFEVSGQTLNTAFKRFKELADKKKQVTALDLEALVTDELRDELRSYSLQWFDVEASSRRPPHATVELVT